MNIFCKETQAHLQMHPHLQESDSSHLTPQERAKLITPDLWLKECKNDAKLNLMLTRKNSIQCSEDDSDSDYNELNLSSLKRKLMETQNNQDEFEENKESKEKSILKEVKRPKQTHIKPSQINRNNGTPNHHLPNQIDWVGHENKELPSVHQTQNQLLNSGCQSVNSSSRGSSSIQTNHQINNGMKLPSSPITLPNQNSSQPFHGVPANINRMDHLRPPLIPPPPPPPPHVFPNSIPNFFAPSNMEMLIRMQQNYNGLRYPLPFPFPHNPPTGFPFPLPPIGFNQPFHHQLPNPSSNSLIPPVTVMVPYPIPIPIPIPVPIILPIFKKFDSKDAGVKNNNENNVSTSGINSKKVESVINKLVEKKTGQISENTQSQKTNELSHESNSNENCCNIINTDSNTSNTDSNSNSNKSNANININTNNTKRNNHNHNSKQDNDDHKNYEQCDSSSRQKIVS